jgi:hypothetical protein
MRTLALTVLLAVVLMLSGCGKTQEASPQIPTGVIARVGDEIVTGSELEAFLTEVRASYEANHRPFPAAGSPEYSNLLAEAVSALVARLRTERSAAELGVSVSEEEIDDRIADLAKHAGLDAELAKAGLSRDRLRADLREKLLKNRIFVTVVAAARPSPADVRAYYDSHLEDYTRWPPRQVDYLFVGDENLALDLAKRLADGGDVAALAAQYGDPGVRQGAITIEDGGPGLLPFQRAAFTLPAGETSVTHSGVGWSVVRPVSPLEPGRVISFEEVADALRIELTEKARKGAMDSWRETSEAAQDAVTRYEPGWDPAGLRREVMFPRPSEPQRSEQACDLPDGEYTYERLAELGCANVFPIPGVDGPLCPMPLVEDHFVGGFDSDEVDSGYAEYLTSGGRSCVPDPRGQTVGLYHLPKPAGPGLSSG